MSRPVRSTRARAAALAGILLALPASLAACSPSAARSATSTPATWNPPACHRPVVHRSAEPVPGSSTDFTVTSFDGTPIRAHWMPLAGATAAHPAPTLLMGPGWSLPGDTDASATSLVDGLSAVGGMPIGLLHRAGYNVLTWDPRGFGKSGGTAEVDSPEFEAKDVSALLDWLATLPGVRLDAPGDPRVGMVGGSYGGGIQYVSAATDCRIDAIAPTIAWNSLVTSLAKADTYKAGWGNLLSSLTAADHVDPVVAEAAAAANATGTVPASYLSWFAARGPGDLVAKIRVPTLIVQGTVDTLFTLQEAADNWALLQKTGVPLSMIWFCGGHGFCRTDGGDPNAVANAVIAWMDRYVKRDASAPAVPKVDIVDQNGQRYTSPVYPVPTSAAMALHGSGHGTLALDGQGDPAMSGGSAGANLIGSVAASIVPAESTNAIDVPVPGPSSGAAIVVGAPQLTVTYSGTTPPGGRPDRLFAQLVDDSTGDVVGNQDTPIDITLDGRPHTVSLPLEIVCQHVEHGQSLTLQLTSSSVSYAVPGLGGSIDVTSASITLPVAATGALDAIG